MAELMRAPMLVIADESELDPARRVWGTGGWLPPEGRPPDGREALDWLTLARLSGWGVSVARRTAKGLEGDLHGGSRFVVIACDPDRLGDEATQFLATKLAQEPVLVVARAGTVDGTFARLAGAWRRSEAITGRALRSAIPGAERRWECRKALESLPLQLSEEASAWGTLDCAPVIAARRVGQGVIAALGFHPSAARDSDGAATALLRHLLIYGAQAPVAWLNLEGTLVLRMDDPGGAQNVHCRKWQYPKLGEAEWRAIAGDLERRDARLSVCYVAGWVDDGDAARGELRVSGTPAARVPGRTHPSPLVKYRDLAGHAPGTLYDYEAEFRGIESLRAAGLGDVEPHGFTHLHPDGAAWAKAPDRYESLSWYRELGKRAAQAISARRDGEHPVALSIKAFENYFAARPTTLVCPGDDWTEEVIERALDLGFFFVNDYHLAIRDGGRFCWTSHVCAPYLSEPDAAWFDAGLPTVGYFHDRELALEGVGWLAGWLDAWQRAGARRLMDFRELAAAVGRRLYLDDCDGKLRLTVRTDGCAPPLVRPLKCAVRSPGAVHLDVRVEEGAAAYVTLPPQLKFDNSQTRALVAEGAFVTRTEGE